MNQKFTSSIKVFLLALILLLLSSCVVKGYRGGW